MAGLSVEEKTKLVKEACQASYAHDFIEALPNVSLAIKYMTLSMTDHD